MTRGWFYTLTILAAALFDKPAFHNCIVGGMLLADDGRKLSKRLKNYSRSGRKCSRPTAPTPCASICSTRRP